jgi:hypothetical protein
MQIRIGGMLNGEFSQAEGDRTVLGYYSCHRNGFFDQLVMGNYFIDQINAECFFRRDKPAGKYQLLCLSQSDQSRQTDGASSSGDNTDVHLSLAEFGILGGYTNITGHCYLTAAAKTKAGYRCNNRFSQPFQPEGQFPQGNSVKLLQRGLIDHGGYVGAGRKYFRSTGKNDNPDLRVRIEFIYYPEHFLSHSLINGISGIGTVQLNNSDPFINLLLDNNR